jgi:hypothetical protein
MSIAVQTFERMGDEIAGIGAHTPHELMRAAEVSFIRDCAEMAARSSLTRTESRWGLYHDRSDLPGRDDKNWRYHLNLRKAADGSMAFLKRPVAPYFVPVPGFDAIPSGDTAPIHVAQPPLSAGQAPASQRSRVRDTAAEQPPSPRIAAVLAVESPTLEDLAGFLADPDPGVRRTAVNALTEHPCDGDGPALFAALGDDDARVRRTAADGVRELVEVLPDPKAVHPHLRSADPLVRGCAVYLLSARRVGSAADYRPAVIGCGSRRCRRWCRWTMPPAWRRPRPTRTARCGWLLRRVWAPCAPAPRWCAACWSTPTLWCARQHWPLWVRSVAPQQISTRCSARCGNRPGRCGRARCPGGCLAFGGGAVAVGGAGRSAPRRA